MVGRFEWHDEKDRSNQEKHGVAFAEAVSVFSDDNCHCYREPHGAIRIISARRATRTERSKYEEKLP